MDKRKGRASWGIVARMRDVVIRSVWAGVELRCNEPLVEEAKQEWWRKIEAQSDCKLAMNRILDEST